MVPDAIDHLAVEPRYDIINDRRTGRVEEMNIEYPDVIETKHLILRRSKDARDKALLAEHVKASEAFEGHLKNTRFYASFSPTR